MVWFVLAGLSAIAGQGFAIRNRRRGFKDASTSRLMFGFFVPVVAIVCAVVFVLLGGIKGQNDSYNNWRKNCTSAGNSVELIFTAPYRGPKQPGGQRDYICKSPSGAIVSDFQH